jgi:hypothetical protein
MLPDGEYFDYSENQRESCFKVQHLKKSIKISDWTDGSILLLNPEVRYGDEYEAWVYANWSAGARRHKSFWDLIKYELENTKEMINK